MGRSCSMHKESVSKAGVIIYYRKEFLFCLINVHTVSNLQRGG